MLERMQSKREDVLCKLGKARKELKLKGVDAELMIERLKSHLTKVQKDLKEKEVVHSQYEKEI